jgi:ubiquinol-cytochrome c reductase iron-sulfur subunit
VSDTLEPRLPTTDELDGMSAEEAMFAGANQDGVQIVHRRDRFPIPGSKA